MIICGNFGVNERHYRDLRQIKTLAGMVSALICSGQLAVSEVEPLSLPPGEPDVPKVPNKHGCAKRSVAWLRHGQRYQSEEASCGERSRTAVAPIFQQCTYSRQCPVYTRRGQDLRFLTF